MLVSGGYLPPAPHTGPTFQVSALKSFSHLADPMPTIFLPVGSFPGTLLQELCWPRVKDFLLGAPSFSVG